MSCGTKIEGRFHTWAERDELADRLEREGEGRIASRVRHGDCLDDAELRRAERALDAANLSKHHDYRETRCACAPEDA